MTTIESLIQSWDGEYVVTQYDRPTGAWIFISIHSTALGTATGGTRMMTYPRLEDALRDGMRLAKGMTHKWAVADFPKGGGKAVIKVPPTLDDNGRRELLLRYGDLLESLGGVFETGPDIGTTPDDMDLIGQQTSHIFGKTTGAGGGGEAGIFTARGVYYGMLACAEQVWGSSDLKDKHILMRGVGSVGSHLSHLLSEAGAQITFTDIDDERIRKHRDKRGLRFIEPDAIYSEPCDIFAPCATGSILNAETIPQLKCRIIGGAANNQLAHAKGAELLHVRNILYAPDYVINAGAAIALPALERMGWTPEQVEGRLQGIGRTLSEIFRQSEQEDAPTAEVAERMAQKRLEAAGR